MLARLGKILIVIALTTMVGLHWTLLQTVAWTGMLANNLCTESLSQAVSNTFNGDHPCPLCRAIAAAKKSEKKSEALAASLKFEFPPSQAGFVLTAPPRFQSATALDSAPQSCRPKPPTPPPRSFFV